MEFEWDPEKCQLNIVKHGIDFYDAVRIWKGNVIDPLAVRSVHGEERPLALGQIGDVKIVIAVVYTMRSGRRRIISARRARRNEQASYHQRFPG